jgi:rhodanese-related sulfurtransferase
MRMLEQYNWPGNVRELRNVIERALLLGSGLVTALPLALFAYGARLIPLRELPSQLGELPRDREIAVYCAVGLRGLRMLAAGTQATVDYLVPNRFEYGYGLTPEIVELAAQREPDLLITVDNGIASVEGVGRASELGIEVLITDHHLPGAVLPAAALVGVTVIVPSPSATAA